MYYFSFLALFLIGIGGLYLGIIVFREYTNITRTVEKVSVLQIVRIAFRSGISGSLFFFAIIIFASVLDKEYVWSLQKVEGALFVSLIPGIIIVLGTTYQIYTTLLFRDMLIRKYKEKDKPGDHKG